MSGVFDGNVNYYACSGVFIGPQNWHTNAQQTNQCPFCRSINTTLKCPNCGSNNDNPNGYGRGDSGFRDKIDRGGETPRFF